MSNNVNIYYDGDSFCQATAIFTDPNLTTYAPSLWYAFGGQKTKKHYHTVKALKDGHHFTLISLNT